MSRKLIFVCQICEKILTRNVDFWEEEKLGYLKKKNSALKTRHLWDLNPGRHFECITNKICGGACEIKRTDQPLISYLILFVMIYHIFCAFCCLK